MITARVTEHLTGIVIEGEHLDFEQLIEAIYRITGYDYFGDPYWGVKNRLLGLCYDIRHASYGDRNVELRENGVDLTDGRFKGRKYPVENVHFSAECYFPEAVFIALSLPELYAPAAERYGASAVKAAREDWEGITGTYADYLKDKALLDLLAASIFQAFAEVVGDNVLENLLKYRTRPGGSVKYYMYVTQFVDKCNLEYLATAPEKRKDKLRVLTKRFIRKNAVYHEIEAVVYAAARERDSSIYDISLKGFDYPQYVEW